MMKIQVVSEKATQIIMHQDHHKGGHKCKCDT